MKTSHVVLFLPALIGATTCLLLRKHIFVNIPLNWLKAQTHCRENYVDLTTVDSPEEIGRFKTDIKDYLSIRSWTGLAKRPDQMDYSYWSDGTVVGYVPWEAGKPDGGTTQNCVTIENVALNDYFCDQTKPFVCYAWQPALVMVQDLMTWYEALLHCRTQYTDLISLSTGTDIFAVNNKIGNFLNVTLWTGLNFLDGSRFWVNKEPVVNPYSLPSCPIQPFRCGAKVGVDEHLKNTDCMTKMIFICYHM
ncbi:putative C-type lectin domain family 20 member A isoform X2 [Hemibagrus wyckioides]|nr:putative C-type lectin domain family 20 member A isoform X1 [Hemibagrus wyckioides]XP_058273755.1 putative C-type lectin domain family 20 member A isoform X2 [Hemibagrus wyckioides]